MNDKELLQMLEVLGKNSRRSFAASDSVKADRDTRCAKTIRNIVEGQSRSFAASAFAPTSTAAANPNPSRNVKGNKVSVLYNFVINNHLR